MFLGVGEEWERGFCCKGIDVSVYFLSIEKNTGERGREVERRVGGVVGALDKGVCKLGGGEGGGEEGFVVDIGGVLLLCCHRDRFELFRICSEDIGEVEICIEVEVIQAVICR